MRFARTGFAVAGLYGLAATLPLYLAAPPPGAALWYYGFAGAAAATQLLYLVIATDPARHRPAIPVGIASKLSFAVPALVLFDRGESGRGMTAAALVDLALAAFFATAFVRLGAQPGGGRSAASGTR